MTDDFSQLTQRAAAEQEGREAEQTALVKQEAVAAEKEFERAAGLFEELLEQCAAELRRLGIKPVKTHDTRGMRRRKWWQLSISLPDWEGGNLLFVEQKLRYWATSRQGGHPVAIEIRNPSRSLPSWSDGGRDAPTRETFVEVNEDVEGGLELVTRRWPDRGKLASAPLRRALAEGVAALGREAGRI